MDARADKLKALFVKATSQAGEPPITPEDDVKLTAICGAIVEGFDILMEKPQP